MATSSRAEITAAARSPATRSGPASVPKTATPMAPPAWRAALETAEATPERARSTLPSMAPIMAGTPVPMPAGISTKAGSAIQ